MGMVGSMAEKSMPKPFGDNALMVMDKAATAAAAVASSSDITVVVSSPTEETIILAGGCFWSVELAFQRLPGVIHTEVGYAQGHVANPTYEEVCDGKTGHAEAVRVRFNPAIVSLEQLLSFFWDFIDPTNSDGQGADEGPQYRSGIYYNDAAQQTICGQSLESKKRELLPKVVYTEVAAATSWYPAEDMHQKYLEKGGQCALKGDTTPIRCYGLPYQPKRMDETARRLLARTAAPAAYEGSSTNRSSIVLAGGMFWGLQLALQRLPGVDETEAGFAQGTTPEPTFELSVAGKTDHVQAVKVTFDEQVLPLSMLIDYFWDYIDPTQQDGQGDDNGAHFRTGIYYLSAAQEKVAIESMAAVQKLFSEPIVTELAACHSWVPVEEFYQRYLEKGGQSARKGDVTPIMQYG